MQEYAVIKIAGGIGGAIGTFAAIVVKKEVPRLEAYCIVSVGVFLSIMVPYAAATSIIDTYHLSNSFDLTMGLAGLLGLVSGLVGFAIVRGLYRASDIFATNPIPFLRKLLGIFGDK